MVEITIQALIPIASPNTLMVVWRRFLIRLLQAMTRKFLSIRSGLGIPANPISGPDNSAPEVQFVLLYIIACPVSIKSDRSRTNSDIQYPMGSFAGGYHQVFVFAQKATVRWNHLFELVLPEWLLRIFPEALWNNPQHNAYRG